MCSSREHKSLINKNSNREVVLRKVIVFWEGGWGKTRIKCLGVKSKEVYPRDSVVSFGGTDDE